MRLFLALLACAGLAACNPSTKTPDPGAMSSIGGWGGVQFFVDPATGCHYLRSANGAAALTPRMRADGGQLCEAPPVRP